MSGDENDGRLVFGVSSYPNEANLFFDYSEQIFYIGTSSHSEDGQLVFMVADEAEAVRIDASGNVGIGVSDPDSLLEVDGNTHIGGTLTTDDIDITSLTSGYVPYYTGAILDDSVIYTDGTNIGVGTNSPDGKLHVFTASSGAVTASASGDDLVVENSDNVGITMFSPDDKYSNIRFGSPSDALGAQLQWVYSTLLFFIGSMNDSGEVSIASANGVEAIRIDSSQNVGIGVSDPDSLLEVDGNTHIGGTLTVNGNVFATALSTDSGTDLIINGSDEICKKSSARRFKKNINDSDINSSILQEFKVVDFDWKSTGVRDFGFIADDLAELFPGIETYSKGNIQSWDTQKMLTLAVAEIQRLNREITLLKERLV